MTPTGYIIPVFHAHLPFIRHPEHADFLEEDWLFEAITETYIPLLRMGEHLRSYGHRHVFTMSVTPPLAEMFADHLLQQRYHRHLEKLYELAGKELHRTRQLDPRLHRTAQMYERNLRLALELFRDRYHDNLIAAFRDLQDSGVLEIITCGATHGFLPLIGDERSVYAQVEVAARNYEKHFHRRPRGIWLPECGYYPGLDRVLKRCGIKYFFVDTHGILLGEPRPKYGNYRPVFCPSGVAAFARDAESSKQVWSAQEGYPGDAVYREFYRDAGYDTPYDYIKPYLHQDGVRRQTGLKYHRVTGKVGLGDKDFYDPEVAAARAEQHAGNFLFNRQAQLRHLAGWLKTTPIVVCPYDAELYGHWWFEGPLFLQHLFRKIKTAQSEIDTITPGEYLRRHKAQQVVTPAFSTWGDKGYCEVWLNGANDWIYRHLHAAELRMSELANRFPTARGLRLRGLKQAARELLLAQSSDWAFIVTNKTSVPYAVKRTRDHLHRFTRLYEDLMSNRVDERWLADVEWRDTIFQEVDYRVWK